MSCPPTLIGEDVLAHMCKLLSTTPQDGCVVEVGVYKGGSLWHLVRAAAGRPVYAYDTFTGIPYKDDIDSHAVGDFNDTSLAAVQAAVPTAIYAVGEFPDSLVTMPPIAFCHVDCDQYRAVKACIDVLGPRMLPGGVMWFDDYGCLQGAIKAVEEAFASRIEIVTGGKAIVRF